MSFALQQAAWELLPGELSPQERVVLLALAEDCRTGRDVASPGHKVLSARTGLARTQLSTTIARLAARGLVSLAEKARRGRNAVYRLLFAPVDNQAPVPATRTQSAPPAGSTGTDHGSESVRSTGTLPGSSSSQENNPSRKRSGGRFASKIRSKGKTDYSATPWRAPAVLPDNPLKPEPRPDRSALAEPPAWAMDAARGQLDARFASPVAVGRSGPVDRGSGGVRLTPRQRAAVRVRLAQAIGEGRPVDRHVVIAELFGADAPVSLPDAALTETRASVLLTPLAVAFLAPDVTPDVAPDDDIVSVNTAARMIGCTPGTVRRYLAPSAHPRRRLVRLGDGVSRASVLALSASRAA